MLDKITYFLKPCFVSLWTYRIKCILLSREPKAPCDETTLCLCSLLCLLPVHTHTHTHTHPGSCAPLPQALLSDLMVLSLTVRQTAAYTSRARKMSCLWSPGWAHFSPSFPHTSPCHNPCPPPAMCGTWVRSLSWEDSPGGGHGNPLQCSCLENPRDRGALWAAVHGVTQGRTRLERLSSGSGTLYCNYLFTLPSFSSRSPWRQGLLYLWIPSIQNKVLSEAWLFCGTRAGWRRGEWLGKTGSTLPFCSPLSASVFVPCDPSLAWSYSLVSWLSLQ